MNGKRYSDGIREVSPRCVRHHGKATGNDSVSHKLLKQAFLPESVGLSSRTIDFQNYLIAKF